MHGNGRHSRRASAWIAATFAVILAAGCARVYAPSMRPADGESPAVLPKRVVAVSVAGGTFDWHNEVNQQHFAQVGITGGLAEGLDVRGTLTASHPYVDTIANPDVAIAARLKYSPPPLSCCFAMIAGVGGGYKWTLASYSLEAGTIFGYENRYFVPFLDYRASFNSNITSSLGGKPKDTGNIQSAVGAKVALLPGRERTPWLQVEVGKNHYLSGATTYGNRYLRVQFESRLPQGYFGEKAVTKGP
ncbi:MAG TPA: hypothetical protein VHO02_06995 [Fibrobacteria bacterium]|nr:hypothetical protein [Fibrobacteria bacterium]